MRGSWKTTLAGVLGIIASAITMIAQPLLDADPATVANFGGFIAFAVPAVGLLFARDANVSSEQQGIK